MTDEQLEEMLRSFEGVKLHVFDEDLETVSAREAEEHDSQPAISRQNT